MPLTGLRKSLFGANHLQLKNPTYLNVWAYSCIFFVRGTPTIQELVYQNNPATYLANLKDSLRGERTDMGPHHSIRDFATVGVRAG
jgi:hypothetical protein